MKKGYARQFLFVGIAWVLNFLLNSIKVFSIISLIKFCLFGIGFTLVALVIELVSYKMFKPKKKKISVLTEEERKAMVGFRTLFSEGGKK